MKKNQKNEQNKDIYVNQNLLNIISPSGISFDNNYADIGEGVGKIFCISRYPSELDYGWLSDIVNLPGAAATVEYRYSPEDIMIAQFNRRISELKSARETERKESEIQRYEHQIEDLKNLINRISVKREPVGFFNVLLHIQDSFLWNGITTLTSKSKYIVLDTSKLLEMDDNIRNAQFFNLSMWQWHRMSQNRFEKVLAHMEEGYLYADPDFPQLMKHIRNISKRGRKYEAGLCFITHSPVDVLDPQVKRFSEAVIDNSCYKFLFGSDGKGLAETIELFKLSEKEIKLLESKTRGKCLFCAGNIRLELRVDVPDMLIEMMGKAGGR